MTAQFEERVETYFHLTTWAPENLHTNRVYATSWDRSAYWNAQQDDSQQIAAMVDDFKTREASAFLQAIGMTAEEAARSKGRVQRQKEAVFEMVRANEFSDAPSRMRCMFVCESEQQLRDYVARYHFPTVGRTIVEIRIGSIDDEHFGQVGVSRDLFDRLKAPRRIRVNPSFLDCNGQHAETVQSAREYWGSVNTGTERLTEVLFEGFFEIKRIVETWPAPPTKP